MEQAKRKPENEISVNEICRRLTEKHLRDLRGSGLSDETILAAGIESITDTSMDEVLKGIGFKNMTSLVESLYRIPYPCAENFCRFRVFSNGLLDDIPKYLQQKGARNHLYMPEYAQKVFDDPSIPLFITEGEKKALKACQEGIPCIGLSGLWNWSNGDKELIKDFDLIQFNGRKTYIVPDNDWKSPNKHGYGKNLEQAVNALANCLIVRGAQVFIKILPEEARHV